MTKYYKHRNCSRILSMFLAFILTLSLLPMSAIATNIDSGTGSTGDDMEGGGVHEDWKAVKKGSTFVRLTIVHFPDGVDNWESGKMTTYGSIDTSSTYTAADMAKVKLWWDTNAVSAKRAGDYLEYYTKGGRTAGYSSQFTEFKYIPGMPSGVSLPSMFGSGTSGEDTMLKLFTDAEGEPNGVFEAVLAAVSAEELGDKPLTAKDFRSDANYRLIIEPGVLTLIDGEVAAMTWRDMAAYSLNSPTTSGNKRPAYTWNSNSQNIAYGLYLTRDEFTTGVGDKAEAPSDGKAIYKAVTETPNIGLGKDTLKFGHFRDHCWDTGYALGIINPGDMGGSEYNSYVGRVNIFLPTGAELAAGPGADPSKNIGTEYYSYLGKRSELVEALIKLPN